MTKLKENLDHYMELKGITMYSHLLVEIAHELGIKGQAAYRFAETERANFSKMLKGERPLKYDFIIPLEKIFGVSLARLLDEDAYKLPVEKSNVPFDKGFRYYAYLDDPDLYRNEFDIMLTKDGKSILNNTDEFGKTFLDYVVEYHSVNGVRYLHDEYGIKLKWYHNHFEFKKSKGMIWIDFENAIGFARFVASMKDPSLFNDIFDSFNMFYTNGHYGGPDSIFYQPQYLEILLDDEGLFKSLFEIRKYDLQCGAFMKRKTGQDHKTYYSVNPIINNCLKHALGNLKKYRKQATEILKFGIRHNRSVAEEMGPENCYVCTELGLIEDFKDKEFCGFIVLANSENVQDEEIKKLIEELPKFPNPNHF